MPSVSEKKDVEGTILTKVWGQYERIAYHMSKPAGTLFLSLSLLELVWTGSVTTWVDIRWFLYLFMSTIIPVYPRLSVSLISLAVFLSLQPSTEPVQLIFGATFAVITFILLVRLQ